MSTNSANTCQAIARLLLIPLILVVTATIIASDRVPEEINSTTALGDIELSPPVTDKGDLYVFMWAMAERESNNNARVVNRYGYMGKYQFGRRTLWSLGRRFRVSRSEFLGNVELQDSAMVQYLRGNRMAIYDIIVRLDGRWYNGVYITESGLLAGAHLVGPHGLRAFFDPSYTVVHEGRSYRPRTVDGNGISVQEYIATFSGYTLDNLN